jgi:predicted Zn-dependent peptidase
MCRLLTAGLIVLVAGAASAAPLPCTVLDNGLSVLAMRSEHLSTASMAIVLPISAADETGRLEGARAVLQQTLALDSHRSVSESGVPGSGLIRSTTAGLDVNTNWDFVEASYTVALDELDEALAMMAEQIFVHELTPESFEQGRELVQRGYDASHDSPVQTTFDLFRLALYGDAPMGRPVQGDPEALEQMSLEALQAFRADHYVPGGAWLCVVSPLPADEAVAAVNRAMGGLPAASPPAEPQVSTPPEESLVEVGESFDLVQASMVVGVPLPSYGDPLFPAGEVIAALLDGPEGRLQRDLSLLQTLGLSLPTRVLEEHYPIGTLPVPAARDPYLAIHALAAPRSIERVRVGLLRHLLALQTGSVTEAELERARQRMINAHRLSTARPAEAALYLARRALFGLGDGDEAVAAIEAVTPEQINAVAARYFNRHAIGVQMPAT